MMRNLTRCAVLAAAIGLGACEDQLEVTNPNSGETKRVLGTPQDAENLLGTYYRRWHSSLYGTGNPPGNFEGMANVMSLMNYSSLANNGQNARAPFSGATNSNAPGNVVLGDQANMYFNMGEVNRVAANFLTSLKSGLNLGSQARENRDRAFAEMLRGLSLGYLAIFHDSAAVISEGMGAEDPGKLFGYKEVGDSAMAAFQRAIDLANAPATGANGFPLPGSWIASPTVYSAPEFVKFVRSYRARIRASIARTPAERAAVNWAAVIADAQNGSTTDIMTTTSTTDGIGAGWRRIYDGGTTWHQMPPFIIGMADTSGTYAAWIAQPVSERGAGNVSFIMATPDLRFPQGTTRAQQQADFAITSCQTAAAVCKRYFANRQTADQFSGLGWGWSNYDYQKAHAWVLAGDAGSARNGNLSFFEKEELDLLQAEGLFRTGNLAGAAALVNITRVRNGLPAITAFDNTSPVPGGNACVPKVPGGAGTGGAFNRVGCGTLFEALKYEKRIETAFTHFAAWFADMRGWGDLPKDTPLFWAVPYQDLQARGTAIADIYGAGIGVGNAPNSAAAVSTYGW